MHNHFFYIRKIHYYYKILSFYIKRGPFYKGNELFCDGGALGLGLALFQTFSLAPLSSLRMFSTLFLQPFPSLFLLDLIGLFMF